MPSDLKSYQIITGKLLVLSFTCQPLFSGKYGLNALSGRQLLLWMLVAAATPPTNFTSLIRYTEINKSWPWMHWEGFRNQKNFFMRKLFVDHSLGWLIILTFVRLWLLGLCPNLKQTDLNDQILGFFPQSKKQKFPSKDSDMQNTGSNDSIM